MDHHFNVCFFSVQTDAFLTMYVWCCGTVTGIFLFSMRSGFVRLKASWWEFYHIANDLITMEAEFHFHIKTFLLLNLIFPCHNNEVKSCSKIRYPAHARVLPFPLNRTLRVFSCFLLANNTLEPVNCLRQLPVSFLFKLTYFLLHFISLFNLYD